MNIFKEAEKIVNEEELTFYAECAAYTMYTGEDFESEEFQNFKAEVKEFMKKVPSEEWKTFEYFYNAFNDNNF